jgi:hypothetical protein
MAQHPIGRLEQVPSPNYLSMGGLRNSQTTYIVG